MKMQKNEKIELCGVAFLNLGFPVASNTWSTDDVYPHKPIGKVL